MRGWSLSVAGVLALVTGRCAPATPAPESVPKATAVVAGEDSGVHDATVEMTASAAAIDASSEGGEEGDATATAAVDASMPPAVDAGPACTAAKKVRWLPAAPAAWTQCGKDAHCLIVPTTCCTCGVLPASIATAVNQPSVQNGNPYCQPQTGCPRCAGFPNPELSAVCLSGRCRVKETIDPCAPKQYPRPERPSPGGPP